MHSDLPDKIRKIRTYKSKDVAAHFLGMINNCVSPLPTMRDAHLNYLILSQFGVKNHLNVTSNIW